MTEYHCKYDELVDPKTLVDHPRNVNKHPRRQLDALSAVIWGPKKADGARDSKKALGWRHSIVVSRRSGFVVMGHARKTVGIEEGEMAPVEYQNFESEAAERAMLRADNRIAELAEIDFELEQIEIKELAALDIPILDFGFEIKDTEKFNSESEYTGMPEYKNENCTSYRKLIVHFATPDNVEEFKQLIGQDFTDRAKYIWHPEAEWEVFSDKKYQDG